MSSRCVVTDTRDHNKGNVCQSEAKRNEKALMVSILEDRTQGILFRAVLNQHEKMLAGLMQEGQERETVTCKQALKMMREKWCLNYAAYEEEGIEINFMSKQMLEVRPREIQMEYNNLIKGGIKLTDAVSVCLFLFVMEAKLTLKRSTRSRQTPFTQLLFTWKIIFSECHQEWSSLIRSLNDTPQKLTGCHKTTVNTATSGICGMYSVDKDVEDLLTKIPKLSLGHSFSGVYRITKSHKTDIADSNIQRDTNKEKLRHSSTQEKTKGKKKKKKKKRKRKEKRRREKRKRRRKRREQDLEKIQESHNQYTEIKGSNVPTRENISPSLPNHTPSKRPGVTQNLSPLLKRRANRFHNNHLAKRLKLRRTPLESNRVVFKDGYSSSRVKHSLDVLHQRGDDLAINQSPFNTTTQSPVISPQRLGQSIQSSTSRGIKNESRCSPANPHKGNDVVAFNQSSIDIRNKENNTRLQANLSQDSAIIVQRPDLLIQSSSSRTKQKIRSNTEKEVPLYSSTSAKPQTLPLSHDQPPDKAPQEFNTVMKQERYLGQHMKKNSTGSVRTVGGVCNLLRSSM